MSISRRDFFKNTGALSLGLAGSHRLANCVITPGTPDTPGSPVQVPPVPGTGLDEALFELSEIDLHLHSGMERPMPLSDWLDLAVADGRKIVALMDHLELYRKSPEEYEQWRAEEGVQTRYAVGSEGHHQLIEDWSQAAAERDDLIIFKGWEIYEGELDIGLEYEAMRLVDVIGWHISAHDWGPPAPDGQHLLRRVEQIKAVQQEIPIPMIVFHPFYPRLSHIQQVAAGEGRDIAEISLSEYQYFHGDEQRRLAEALEGQSIYLEISHTITSYWEDPTCREALIAAIRPLAKLGVQFTVSTDAHGVRDAKHSFRPETYCEVLGCTPANTNTILRELLAQKTLKSIG